MPQPSPTMPASGVTAVFNVHVTPDESAWAYTYDRTISDLYVVEGLR